MQLYSIEEIIADIEHFEGVQLKSADLQERLRKCHYPKLYSQTHTKPMSGQMSVNDLRRRVDSFLFAGCLIDPDILPNCEMEDLVVYALNSDGQEKISMSLIGSYRDLADLQDKLPVVKLKEMDVNSCVFLNKSTGSCLVADVNIGQLH